MRMTVTMRIDPIRIRPMAMVVALMDMVMEVPVMASDRFVFVID